VSKQALFERINNKACVDFAKSLFQQALNKKIASITEGLLFQKFNRVLIQDSTTLRLPPSLSEAYPGKCWQRAAACSASPAMHGKY